jgi:hypothetical protein
MLALDAEGGDWRAHHWRLLIMGALRAADLWSFRVVREALKGPADTLVVGTPFALSSNRSAI